MVHVRIFRVGKGKVTGAKGKRKIGFMPIISSFMTDL